MKSLLEIQLHPIGYRVAACWFPAAECPGCRCADAADVDNFDRDVLEFIAVEKHPSVVGWAFPVAGENSSKSMNSS